MAPLPGWTVTPALYWTSTSASTVLVSPVVTTTINSAITATGPLWPALSAWGGSYVTNSAGVCRCEAGCCVHAEPFEHRHARFKPRGVNRKAQRLLAACLSREQRRDLIRFGHFDVALKASGARYRLRRGYHFNVLRLGENGEPVERLCAERGSIPAEDLMLAQKLMLESDEEAFRRLANIDRPEAAQ